MYDFKNGAMDELSDRPAKWLRFLIWSVKPYICEIIQLNGFTYSFISTWRGLKLSVITQGQTVDQFFSKCPKMLQDKKLIPATF